MDGWAFILTRGETRRETNSHNGTHNSPNEPLRTKTERQPNRGVIAATTRGAAMLPKLMLIAPKPPANPISAGSRYVTVALPNKGMPADSPSPSPMRQTNSPEKLRVSAVAAPASDQIVIAIAAPARRNTRSINNPPKGVAIA